MILSRDGREMKDAFASLRSKVASSLNLQIGRRLPAGHLGPERDATLQTRCRLLAAVNLGTPPGCASILQSPGGK